LLRPVPWHHPYLSPAAVGHCRSCALRLLRSPPPFRTPIPHSSPSPAPLSPSPFWLANLSASPLLKKRKRMTIPGISPVPLPLPSIPVPAPPAGLMHGMTKAEHLRKDEGSSPTDQLGTSGCFAKPVALPTLLVLTPRRVKTIQRQASPPTIPSRYRRRIPVSRGLKLSRCQVTKLRTEDRRRRRRRNRLQTSLAASLGHDALCPPSTFNRSALDSVPYTRSVVGAFSLLFPFPLSSVVSHNKHCTISFRPFRSSK
jgi:hypothetical protein